MTCQPLPDDQAPGLDELVDDDPVVGTPVFGEVGEYEDFEEDDFEDFDDEFDDDFEEELEDEYTLDDDEFGEEFDDGDDADFKTDLDELVDEPDSAAPAKDDEEDGVTEDDEFEDFEEET
jgi:hypothetical protein